MGRGWEKTTGEQSGHPVLFLHLQSPQQRVVDRLKALQDGAQPGLSAGSINPRLPHPRSDRKILDEDGDQIAQPKLAPGIGIPGG